MVGMRRWWLVVLAVVGGLGTHAEAKQISCAPPISYLVLPREGATNVPLNAKLWRFDRLDTGLGLVETPMPELAANTTYERPGTQFTTGDARDTTPPARPHDVYVEVEVSNYDRDVQHRRGIETFGLFGIYDPDTAIIRVTISYRFGTVRFYTTPDRLFLCSPEPAIDDGPSAISIVAIDLAGNESEPFVTMVTPTVRPHFRCGTGTMGLLLVVPVLIVGLLLGLLIGRAVRQALIRRMPATTVSLLAAESIARSMLGANAILTALGMLLVIGSLAIDDLALAVLLGPVPLIGLRHLWLCRGVLALVDRPGATAERRKSWLIVASLDKTVQLRVNEQLFRLGSVPVAAVTLRRDE